jgi:hypothetical protein
VWPKAAVAAQACVFGGRKFLEGKALSLAVDFRQPPHEAASVPSRSHTLAGHRGCSRSQWQAGAQCNLIAGPVSSPAAGVAPLPPLPPPDCLPPPPPPPIFPLFVLYSRTGIVPVRQQLEDFPASLNFTVAIQTVHSGPPHMSSMVRQGLVEASGGAWAFGGGRAGRGAVRGWGRNVGYPLHIFFPASRLRGATQ